MQHDYRYEIKFEIEPHQADSINDVILLHPLSFKKAFPDRWVNSIYLDTPDLTTCQDNLNGISDRKKFRLRWYGDILPIKASTFEIKIKSNMVGRKENTKMPAGLSLEELLRRLEGMSQLPHGLQPTIQNRYLRSYYINMEGDFRITVDRHLQHAAFRHLHDGPTTSLSSYERIIMELKFDVAAIARHKEVTRYIPYRQTKHSKYVTAVLSCLAYV